MTPTEKKRALIESKLMNTGWVKDRWGHFKRTNDGEMTRLKMQKSSIRYEVKNTTGWINLRSDYYKNVDVVKDGIVIKGGVVK